MEFGGARSPEKFFQRGVGEPRGELGGLPENGGEGRVQGGGIGGRESELVGDFRKGIGGIGFEGVVE